MTYWTAQPVFRSYLAVALLALALLLVWWFIPTFRKLTPSRRRILLALRLSIIALVVLALLRPTRVSTTSRPQRPVLLVLLDQSRSMELPNVSVGQTRWQAQRELMTRVESQLQRLIQRMDVKVYTYDAELRSVDVGDQKIELPVSATGKLTDIGESLAEAVRRELGKRLAAVILMGDGTQTAFDPANDPYAAARDLGAAGYPLYSVVFGPSGDMAEAKDVAVENLPEKYVVFVKNELIVQGALRVRGYTNQQIPIELTLTNEKGEQLEIGRVTRTADQDGQQVTVRVPFTPREIGRYQLTMRAAVQPGELVTDNNELSAYLTVLEGGLKVLYLEGTVRQEQKFIRWAIDASPDLDLDYQWFPSRLRSTWPASLGNALTNQQYDVFILGDLDSAALSKETWATIAEQVRGGKGLIMLGGYHSFGPGGYSQTEIASVLPVELDRFARQSFDAPDQERWHLPGPIPLLPVRSHPLTRLATPDKNADVWQRLAPMKGGNRFQRVKQVPGVQVLLESDRRQPMLVAGEAGSGRTLAFAGDSTWQWWRQGQQPAHKRFWRQIVLWLARRDDMSRNDVWIELAQRRLLPGTPLEFSAGARTATGDAITDAEIKVQLLEGSDIREIPIAADGDLYAGKIDDELAPGNYTLRVTATSGGQALGNAEARFQVLDRDLELASPAADADHMSRLAAFTREAGGRRVPAEQVPSLLTELINNPPEAKEEVLTRWTLGDTWWDSWIFVALLVGLLTAEWYCRKKWGLV